MCAIHELLVFLHVLVSSQEKLQSFFIQSSNGFLQIPIIIRIFNINLLIVKIDEQPRKNWILCQIIERSVSQFVEFTQVVKIGNAPIDP